MPDYKFALIYTLREAIDDLSGLCARDMAVGDEASYSTLNVEVVAAGKVHLLKLKANDEYLILRGWIGKRRIKLELALADPSCVDVMLGTIVDAQREATEEEKKVEEFRQRLRDA